MSLGRVTREQKRYLARENLKYPMTLMKVHPSEWEHIRCNPMPIEVWRSRKFLVQVFKTSETVTRLSVNKLNVDDAQHRWAEGISWDELQTIKREVGFGEYDAVEIYPADKDIVNVANMRHLWVLSESLAYKWRNELG